MSLVDSVSGSASFYRKLFYAFFQLGFNELKEFIRAHIRLGILGDIRTDGQGNIPKLVKKAKLTLKVGGKTYAAKTNSKGKATFKINKLTKKGKYTATIKYAGNGTYKAATKKVRIVVK